MVQHSAVTDCPRSRMMDKSSALVLAQTSDSGLRWGTFN
jgi:hypothetical protein